MPPAPPTAKARDSAVAILYRRAPDGLDVFWLQRGKALRFGGGFHAFPGGRLDADDAQVPVDGAEGQAAALRVTAARELFEEAGVLRARGATMPDAQTLAGLRRRLLEGAVSFKALLEAHGLHLDARDFPEAGRWVTPAYLPLRFDTRFFLVEAPAGQAAEVFQGEASWGGWTTPGAALGQWEKGAALLHPPTLHVLRALDGGGDEVRLLAALRRTGTGDDGVTERIEFQRGVLTFPLRTATLLPATHTSAFLLGTGDCLLVDPGAEDESEVERLVRFVEALGPSGYRPRAIVLTHHHRDHVAGAAHAAKRLGLPVWAHRETATRVDVPVARHLEDGEVLSLGGPWPMRWQVLHTPGHAPGHLVLRDEASQAAVVGDMVAGVGTIVIDPPEGDMAAYVRQLERLKSLPVTTLYPAHGPALADGVATLERYLTHRAWREAKVLAALEAAGGSIELDALVPRAYDDVEAFVWPLAERSTRAILIKLEAEGRVQHTKDGWRGSAADEPSRHHTRQRE